MARRYAHGGKKHEADLVNQAIAAALELGLNIEDDKRIGKYASDEAIFFR